MKAADPSSDGIQCMGHILFWYRKVLLFWALNPAEANKVLGETLVSRFDPPPISSGSGESSVNEPRKAASSIIRPAYVLHRRRLVLI